MAGINGSGNGSDDHDDVTPAEAPRATLEAHRPYVMALVGCIAPLNEGVNMLREILHEIRIAEQPFPQRTLNGIAAAGGMIENVGRTIREQFGVPMPVGQSK